MQGDRDGGTKLPKLTGAIDLINWRRRVTAYIQKQDIELLGLKPRPVDGPSDRQRQQLKFMVKKMRHYSHNRGRTTGTGYHRPGFRLSHRKGPLVRIRQNEPYVHGPIGHKS